MTPCVETFCVFFYRRGTKGDKIEAEPRVCNHDTAPSTQAEEVGSHA
jgi:hypothetical protein